MCSLNIDVDIKLGIENADVEFGLEVFDIVAGEGVGHVAPDRERVIEALLFLECHNAAVDSSIIWFDCGGEVGAAAAAAARSWEEEVGLGDARVEQRHAAVDTGLVKRKQGQGGQEVVGAVSSGSVEGRR